MWRDVWERYIALLAWLLCIPTLGICRGMQLMNVGARRDALPGLAGTMAQRAASAAASSRTRASLFLHLEHAPHSTALSRRAG